MQWEGISEFVYVAENESFTLASKKMAISTAQVSRQISALEKRLNIKLFYRTTRKVSLTEEGRIFYQHCRSVLDGLDAAEGPEPGVRVLPQVVSATRGDRGEQDYPEGQVRPGQGRGSRGELLAKCDQQPERQDRAAAEGAGAAGAGREGGGRHSGGHTRGEGGDADDRETEGLVQGSVRPVEESEGGDRAPPIDVGEVAQTVAKGLRRLVRDCT